MKKRLLFVNGHLNVGGIEKSLTDLLCALDYSCFDVDLLLLDGTGTYTNRLPKQVNVLYRDNSHVYGPLLKTLWQNLIHLRIKDIIIRLVLVLHPFVGPWILPVLRPILGIQRKYDCAIAYRVGSPNEVVSSIVRAKKKICWWHNGECNYDAQQIAHIKRLWKNMDAIVAVSHGCKEMISEKFSIDENIIHVIPNIIDVDTIQQMAGNVNPYTDKASVHIVTLGRLCWEKHIEDVPEIALNLLNKGVSDFKWYIIGDGTKREEISTKIKNYDLTDKVIMLGQKKNPYPYLKYADMMVHTSHVEAHCLTLLEAMALKTPCVATKTVLPQDFTENGVNCLLAEQNVEDQTVCILRLYNYPFRQPIIENAIKMVKNRYSSHNIIDNITYLF